MDSSDLPSHPFSIGERRSGIDPRSLKPSRPDLIPARLEFQRSLIRAGRERFSPILVNMAGVIIDGHHAVRAAAEEDVTVSVFVSDLPLKAKSAGILDLPLR